MMMYRIVSMINPSSCIGLRPHLSTRKKVVQTPGISPATERMMLPTEIFFKFTYTASEPVSFALGDPNPMAWRMMEVFRPKP